MTGRRGLNREERIIVKKTVQATSELLRIIISRHTPYQRAKILTKPLRQSDKSVAGTSILYNVVDGVQKLPAPRRKIRRRLPGNLSQIHKSTLSEILQQFVRMGLFKHITESVPLPRGRPKGMGFEDTDRGGVRSYYDKSTNLNQAIQALEKDKVRRSINSQLLQDGILEKFLIFRILVLYHLIRVDVDKLRKQVEPFPVVKATMEAKQETFELFVKRIKSLSRIELEKEAKTEAQSTLAKGVGDINFFINVLAETLAFNTKS